MGLLDIFKSPEQTKKQQQIDQLRKKIFPGGNQQQDKEVQEVRELLHFKYSKESVVYTYSYAVITYFTSNTPQSKDVIAAILRNSKCPVTREDAEKICSYIEVKRAFKPIKSVGQSLNDLSDAEKLFMVAYGGIVEIKRAYKDLTNEGKFEVLLFNSLIALQEYQSNCPEKYELIVPDFFKKLFNQARVYGIQMNADDLALFVNSRFELYLNEIISFYNETDSSFLLLKTYTCFYVRPLEINPGTSYDLFEYPMFIMALTQMRNYIIEKSFTLF